VIDTQRFSRRMSLTEDQRKEFERNLKAAEKEGNEQIAQVFGELVGEVEKIIGRKVTDEDGVPMIHTASSTR
jgi:DNA-directed RNA polymerase subunit beta